MDTAIFIIALIIMFAGGFIYPFWWFFFSKEATIKLKLMGNYNYDGSEKELKTKINGYKLKRDKLLKQLEADGYNEETLSDIRIMEHRIEVCTQRIKGEWKGKAIENIKEVL